MPFELDFAQKVDVRFGAQYVGEQHVGVGFFDDVVIIIVYVFESLGIIAYGVEVNEVLAVDSRLGVSDEIALDCNVDNIGDFVVYNIHFIFHHIAVGAEVEVEVDMALVYELRLESGLGEFGLVFTESKGEGFRGLDSVALG